MKQQIQYELLQRGEKQRKGGGAGDRVEIMTQDQSNDLIREEER